MNNPNTPSDLLQQIMQSRKTKTNLPPQPIDADEAAAQCLALLTDPDSAVLPADAFRELAKRNAALLNAPREEIIAALSRQVVLLEATATRFLSKAALTSNTDHACALTKLSLSATRSLVATLGAIHAMSEDAADSKAIDAAVA